MTLLNNNTPKRRLVIPSLPQDSRFGKALDIAACLAVLRALAVILNFARNKSPTFFFDLTVAQFYVSLSGWSYFVLVPANLR